LKSIQYTKYVNRFFTKNFTIDSVQKLLDEFRNTKQAMLLLLPLIKNLQNLSALEVIGLKKSLEQDKALSLLNVLSILNQCGLADDQGQIVSDEVLSDFLTLASANPQERQAFIEALQPLDPLRRFHDIVLADPGDNSKTLLDAIAKRVGKSARVDIAKEPTFEESLLAAFEKHGDFSNGELSSPSLSSAPYRILWTYRGDLADGFEANLTPSQLAQKNIYRLVSEGRFDELEKLQDARSIPAFKAWHRMSDQSAPPIIKSHVFLHLGKKTLRWSLYSTMKIAPGETSFLFEKIKGEMENSRHQLSDGWVIAGPPSHRNLSISKIFERNSLDELSLYIEYSIKAWQECRALIKSIGKPSTGM
jgi:hypothetical protein